MHVSTVITLEIIRVFLAYFISVVVPPAIVFGSRFKEKEFKFPFRIAAYATFGNAFIIALVLYLNLFHIFHFITLVLFTVLGYAIIGIVLYQIDVVQVFLDIRSRMQSINQGYLGRRTYFHKVMDRFRRLLRKVLSGPWEVIRENPFETLGFAAISALSLYLFGKNEYTTMGYTASDLPVHNYWINGLAVNEPFRDGVYPMGYHAVVVYLYELFHIDVYVLLRHWDILTVMLIVLSILTFTAYICKRHSFLPFLAVFLFVAPSFVDGACFGRFLAGIPQEYGHAFVLPSVMFLFEFMYRRTGEVAVAKAAAAKTAETEDSTIIEEIKTEEKPKKKRGGFFALKDEPRETKEKKPLYIWFQPSTMCLICFAGGLSVTVSVHFYATIALILFVIGFGVGYLPRIFKRPYFFSLVKSGILAAMTALPPMLLALVMGISFNGSMGWALNVISGNGGADGGDAVIADATDEEYQDDLAYYRYMERNEMLDDQGQQEYTEVKQKAGVVVLEQGQKLRQKVQSVINGFYNAAIEQLFSNDEGHSSIVYSMMLLLMFAFGSGVVLMLSSPDKGGMLITVSVAVGLFWMVLSAGYLGLPEVMDANRTRTFFVTLFGIVVALDVDVVLSILFHFFKRRWIHSIASFSIVWLIVLLFVANDWINEPFYAEGFEYNGAMICLQRILDENEDFSFCIVSANDENNMVALRGYHYETLTFLKHLALYRDEGFDADLSIDDLSEEGDSDIYIPNKTVYFFIEKVPKDWGVAYDKSGQTVSRAGAARPLPYTGSQFVSYQGEARWVLMSKMYYWAIVYKARMSDNFTVFYEDADFICYKATQNTYSLSNFAISYGYNDCGEGEITFDD